MTFLRILCACCVLFSPLASAAADTAAPLLMLETGMHSAGINDAATDAEGRWLVTSSSDRTARIWRLSDGKLLNVLRPPIGNDGVGRINAVVMSRDGALIVLAGQTGRGLSGDNTYVVYLYDRATGQMQGTLRGFKNAISALAITKDAKRLAVGMTGNGGVVLLDLQSRTPIARDTDYRNNVGSLDFNAEGTALVASSLDGELRRYRVMADGFTREQRRGSAGGAEPFRVKFSPDGKLLAVGHSDSTQVMVLHAADLSTAWVPSMQGTERRSPRDLQTLQAVAWSADGAYLYAAGRWLRDSQAMLRRWESADPKTYTDRGVARNTIYALLALQDGRLIVAAADPSWRVLAPDGSAIASQNSPLADFRNKLLSISHDGKQVGFSYGVGASSAVFDLSAGLIFNNRPLLSPPMTSTPSLVLENWINQERPRLNGIELALIGNETGRSATMSSDSKYVAIGGGSRIYLFDSSGRRLWTTPSYGTAWGLALSGDGRWLVAANGDGTIRWHRTTDGTEALKLFLHADRQRWVLSTPAGYYKASVGGEDLIGWSINRGPEQSADFLPASRLRETFQRADIVSNALDASLTLASAAPRLADLAPPVVAILQPGREVDSDKPIVHLRVSTRTLGAVSSTLFKVRVNGQSAELLNMKVSSSPAENALGDGVVEFDVAVPRQDSTIAVFAENANGVSSPALLTVRRPSGAASPDVTVAKPKLYVLAIGVSDYPQADLKLDFAAKDARDFVAALTRNSKGLYRDVEVRTLTDAKAKRDAIFDGLEWLRRQTTHRDVAVLFMAGHGVNDADGTFYFLPHGGDPERLKRTGIIDRELRNTLTALPGKVLFFVDSCHAGNVFGAGRRGFGSELSGLINELSSAENGVLAFSASTGRQFSLENKAWGNGAFTKALVDGLNGAADAQKTGRITHKMLDFYVSETVKKLTDGKQTPVTIIPQGVPDFPIALTAAGK